MARGGRGGRGNVRFAEREEPRAEDRRGGRGGRGTAAPRGAPHGRRRGSRRAAERREVHAPVPADGGHAEDRRLSVHDAHAQSRRRRGGRRAVRRGRHPRAGRGRPRGEGPRASVPASHHAMPCPRPRRGPLLPGPRAPTWTPSARSSAPTTPSSRSGRSLVVGAKADLVEDPHEGRGRDPRAAGLGGDGRGPGPSSRSQLETMSRQAAAEQPPRAPYVVLRPGRRPIHRVARGRWLAGRRPQRRAVGPRDGHRRRTGSSPTCNGG